MTWSALPQCPQSSLTCQSQTLADPGDREERATVHRARGGADQSHRQLDSLNEGESGAPPVRGVLRVHGPKHPRPGSKASEFKPHVGVADGVRVVWPHAQQVDALEPSGHRQGVEGGHGAVVGDDAGPVEVQAVVHHGGCA